MVFPCTQDRCRARFLHSCHLSRHLGQHRAHQADPLCAYLEICTREHTYLNDHKLVDMASLMSGIEVPSNSSIYRRVRTFKSWYQNVSGSMGEGMEFKVTGTSTAGTPHVGSTIVTEDGHRFYCTGKTLRCKGLRWKCAGRVAIQDFQQGKLAVLVDQHSPNCKRDGSEPSVVEGGPTGDDILQRCNKSNCLFIANSPDFMKDHLNSHETYNGIPTFRELDRLTMDDPFMSPRDVVALTLKNTGTVPIMANVLDLLITASQMKDWYMPNGIIFVRKHLEPVVDGVVKHNTVLTTADGQKYAPIKGLRTSYGCLDKPCQAKITVDGSLAYLKEKHTCKPKTEDAMNPDKPEVEDRPILLSECVEEKEVRITKGRAQPIQTCKSSYSEALKQLMTRITSFMKAQRSTFKNLPYSRPRTFPSPLKGAMRDIRVLSEDEKMQVLREMEKQVMDARQSEVAATVHLADNSSSRNKSMKRCKKSMENLKKNLKNQPRKQSRKKVEKNYPLHGNCITYIILHPDALKILSCNSLSESEKFNIFVRSIIYIGKSIFRNRPLDHCNETIDVLFFGDPDDDLHPKHAAIADLWRSGQGVVTMIACDGVDELQALFQEFCMTSAVGLGNTCNLNLVITKLSADIDRWTIRMKNEYGAHLLHNAFEKFLAEKKTSLLTPEDFKDRIIRSADQLRSLRDPQLEEKNMVDERDIEMPAVCDYKADNARKLKRRERTNGDDAARGPAMGSESTDNDSNPDEPEVMLWSSGDDIYDRPKERIYEKERSRHGIQEGNGSKSMRPKNLTCGDVPGQDVQLSSCLSEPGSSGEGKHRKVDEDYSDEFVFKPQKSDVRGKLRMKKTSSDAKKETPSDDLFEIIVDTNFTQELGEIVLPVMEQEFGEVFDGLIMDAGDLEIMDLSKFIESACRERLHGMPDHSK